MSPKDPKRRTPATRSPAKKSTAKKAGAKQPTAKKATTKTTAKKATAKKQPAATKKATARKQPAATKKPAAKKPTATKRHASKKPTATKRQAATTPTATKQQPTARTQGPAMGTVPSARDLPDNVTPITAGTGRRTVRAVRRDDRDDDARALAERREAERAERKRSFTAKVRRTVSGRDDGLLGLETGRRMVWRRGELLGPEDLKEPAAREGAPPPQPPFVPTAPPSPYLVLLSPPDVGAAEREALLAAFDSGWVAPVGPELDAFEEALTKVTGREHAVALASGTAALHLALRALNIGPGDEVLVADLTFVASANAVVHAGATPVFVDVDPDTWTIDVDLVAEELAERRRTGRRMPAAIIPVDLYGRPSDHARLTALADEYEIAVVGDAAEALGATFRGRPVTAYGDAAILSFNGNKIITTGGGGALVTDDPHYAARVRKLATQAREPVLHYEHREIGWNERLSNLSAAIGRAQLKSLGARVESRRGVNRVYRSELEALPGLTFQRTETKAEANEGTWSSAWLTCLTIDPETARVTRDELIARLAEHRVESRPVWKPMTMQPVYQGARRIGHGVASRLYLQGLALPSGRHVDDAALANILGVFRAAWRAAGYDRIIPKGGRAIPGVTRVAKARRPPPDWPSPSG